jgi:UDP-N-acetylglucosamine diphosphorylase / glucose-1-phosphate thymidylyltransferase / UDP-N-acetylgalactosamine diphosphorylase / glucosamine-1-phosphate N-acetyltransferase / galactosamine-1-phosphate N-acetyltransferase
MNIIYFEDQGYERLLPLTWLRQCAELRCGRDRLVDKLCRHAHGVVVRCWARPAIAAVAAERMPSQVPDPQAGWCLVNTRALVAGDVTLPGPGLAWQVEGELVAAGIRAEAAAVLTYDMLSRPELLADWLGQFRIVPPPPAVTLVRYPWDLIHANAGELRRQLTAGGQQQGQVYAGAHLLAPENICIERGVKVKPGVVLDAEDGPIEIGRDVLIQPNVVVEGPCYIGPGSVIRPGAALRPGTSIGPVCRVGGEIDGSIIHGYTNKQHDGFLGHSYLGEWVNLGADTITSDLKNTYGSIRVSLCGRGVETGQHFLGSIVGDHSKTGIGTILPTGCVIGVAANVFTPGTVPKFVPSFAWLTEAGMTAYRVEKALDIARIVMARRDRELSLAESELLCAVARDARQVEEAGWV